MPATTTLAAYGHRARPRLNRLSGIGGDVEAVAFPEASSWIGALENRIVEELAKAAGR